MRVVVTGAGGFIGRRLLHRLADGTAGLPEVRALTAVDLGLPVLPAGVRAVTGSLADPAVRAAALDGGVDLLFHLAAIPGGAAEADQALGWTVNQGASFALLDALAAGPGTPRVVYASTIAVFGAPLPAQVDDATLPAPSTSYGAQKLMTELLIADLTRRGGIDGRAVRLPGVVARPRQRSGLGSAYLSELFHALAAGEPVTLPVGPDATSWLMSVECAVDNLLHAATLPPDALPARRAWTLPALRLRMADLASAIAAACGRPDGVVYRPDPATEALFGSNPPLSTRTADALGFRHDGTAAQLIGRVLPGSTSACQPDQTTV